MQLSKQNSEILFICDLSFFMGLHDENGGIYQMFFSDDNSGSIEKIVNNGASICNKMRSLKEDFHGYAHAPTDSL